MVRSVYILVLEARKVEQLPTYYMHANHHSRRRVWHRMFPTDAAAIAAL